MARPTLVFDLETRRLADEVGGWSHIEQMGLACAVVLNLDTGEFKDYLEPDASRLADDLQGAGLIVGFNVKRFDYAVLQVYTSLRLSDLPTLDLLEQVERRLGFRLTLDSLARGTLGAAKAADDIQAVRWFRDGQVDKVLDYCRQDVVDTRGLYEYGRAHKYLNYYDRYRRLKWVPVQW